MATNPSVHDRLKSNSSQIFGSPDVRVGVATPKGYLRDDLADAFARYLAVPAATSATTSKSLVNAANDPAPRTLDVADAETVETPWDYADVADVALDGDEAAS